MPCVRMAIHVKAETYNRKTTLCQSSWRKKIAPGASLIPHFPLRVIFTLKKIMIQYFFSLMKKNCETAELCADKAEQILQTWAFPGAVGKKRRKLEKIEVKFIGIR